jgi:hypothetical protein
MKKLHHQSILLGEISYGSTGLLAQDIPDQSIYEAVKNLTGGFKEREYQDGCSLCKE